MNTIHSIELMQRLHQLIVKEETGSSAELSSVLKISRRTVQDYLKTLRTMGADLCYDTRRNTYFYKNKFRMTYFFEVAVDD